LDYRGWFKFARLGAIHLFQFLDRDLIGWVNRKRAIQALPFALRIVHHSRQDQPRVNIVWVDSQRLLEKFDRFVIFACVGRLDRGLHKWMHRFLLIPSCIIIPQSRGF